MDGKLPLYKMYIEAMSEPYHHLDGCHTWREAQIIANRIGVQGFTTNPDNMGDILYIPPYRIKRIGIILQSE